MVNSTFSASSNVSAFAYLRDQLAQNIKTARLVLSTPDRKHLIAMARLANNEFIHSMLARLPHPYTQNHAIDFIENGARSARDHAYAISLTDETFIGIIGLAFNDDQAPEVGYWLGEPYWGEGYGSEAVAALLGAADAAGFDVIDASARSENLASIAVLTKNGFVKTGETTDNCGVHKAVPVVYLRRTRER